ncbi:BDNF/NT-3 growth factors receptor isoform X2 [Eurytemora carolleeae]|nr:BDNF/NT-3 growth factors receptor isoform X2 [Eurytemora carolleeae]|eukprot:XP_023323677.1 BDNF/NT-3 growth factors receptor-like isoform X2 [Eurytemora affinis]
MDATAGLDALFNKGIAHPDLATRTCILTRDLTLKLCDYGLGRSLYPQDYWPIYTDSVPVRWCSSSQIQKQENRMVPVYTKPTSSDNIWALGVLIWEILCWGEEPYKHLTNKDVVSRLENDVDMRPYFKLRMIDENNMRARCILTLVHNSLNPLTRSSPKSILSNLDNIGKAGDLQLLQVYNELLD